MPFGKISKSQILQSEAPEQQPPDRSASNQFVRKTAIRKVRKPVGKVYAARDMARAQNLKRQYIKVEDCTSMYLLSLLDPTSEESRGACIPSGFPMPSQKVRAYCRGSFNVGTTGNGFIAFRPMLVNDFTALTFTGSASVGDAGTILSAYTNLAGDSFNKLPFTTAQVVTNSTVSGRIVSACLRVRYAGTEASRAGLITTLEHPDHGSLFGISPNDIAQFENAYRERPSGDGLWTQVNWSGPVSPSEVEYVNLANVITTGTPIAITINGNAASASYEYEAWINVEYIGKDTVGKSINHVDEQGYGNTLQAVKGVSGTKSLTPQAASSVLEKFGNAVIDNMPQIVGTIGKGIDAFSPGSMIAQAYKSIWGNNPSNDRGFYRNTIQVY